MIFCLFASTDIQLYEKYLSFFFPVENSKKSLNANLKSGQKAEYKSDETNQQIKGLNSKKKTGCCTIL